MHAKPDIIYACGQVLYKCMKCTQLGVSAQTLTVGMLDMNKTILALTEYFINLELLKSQTVQDVFY